MGTHSPIQTLFTALLVVAFGWGSGWIVLRGIEYFQPTTIAVETAGQQAAIIQKGSGALADNIEHSTIKIMIGGDIMFDRGIRAIGERNGYSSLFDDSVKELFKEADLVVANLEGPITDKPSKTLVNGKTTDSFTFTFPLAATEALKDAGITMVSLANNHTDNFGSDGYYSTQRYLRDAGIEWFGNPWNSTSTKLTLRSTPDSAVSTFIERDGITIALVGYHAFQLGVDRVVDEIRRVSGPNVFTIVMPHWGEEYVTTPSAKMRSYARAFIAAGADAVIAAHPHIIAEHEWINGAPVYYSIGNLLFDQYFSPEVKRGLIVELDISTNGHTVSLDRVGTHDAITKPGIGVSLEK
ncbi:MAG: CapA family protein [Candidatus Pacebacteria bacterium]|nr:CapA family protein [Candidatus Paceibacterota bacterium]